MNIKYIETTTSTNDTIKIANKNLSLLWCEEQTAGRGQKGNHWESERGRNLTFSIMTHPEFMPAECQFVLSKAVSLALIDTLAAHSIKATIKWPNDIYVNDKKICGILIECGISGSGQLNSAVIGIGLNVNQTLFTSDAPNPTSMKLETGIDFSREAILEEFCQLFETNYTMLAENLYSPIDNRYKENLYRKDGFHSYQDDVRTFEASICEISKYGALILKDRDGVKKEYQFKEVSFL